MKWWWFGLVGGALLAARKTASPGAPDPAPGAPPPAPGPMPGSMDREGWVQLEDAPGLAVRTPSRSWTSPAVRQLLLAAGQVAAQLGGKLQVGDVGPALRGSVYPPHKSHRWGRDLDLAFTLDAYPTPEDVPVDPRLVMVLSSMAPHIEVAGANATRTAALIGRGFKVSAWDGHTRHVHLRLLPELVSSTATT